MCFLSSFFPKFWRRQIVPLPIFLGDNLNCSVGLAQWHGLAQTLSDYAPICNVKSWKASMWRKHLLHLNGMLFHLKLPLAFCQMSLTDKDRCLQGSKFSLTWLNQPIYYAIWDRPHFLPKLNDGCGETDVHFYHIELKLCTFEVDLM